MATMADITDSSLDCTSFDPHSSAKQTIGHFAELVTKGSKPTSDAALWPVIAAIPARRSIFSVSSSVCGQPPF